MELMLWTEKNKLISGTKQYSYQAPEPGLLVPNYTLIRPWNQDFPEKFVLHEFAKRRLLVKDKENWYTNKIMFHKIAPHLNYRSYDSCKM
jgi:hypothetical protein